jgi:hypothetical protein
LRQFRLAKWIVPPIIVPLLLLILVIAAAAFLDAHALIYRARSPQSPPGARAKT